MVEKQPESPQVIRYSEFAKDPEAIIDNCNLTGESAVITNHGRLSFIIEPLDVQPSAVDTQPTE